MAKKQKEAKEQKPKPILVLETKIKVYNNGYTEVEGFPKSLYDAMNLMSVATRIITKAFIDAKGDNRLSDNYEIDGSNILMPKQNKIVTMQ